ncbi:uncharacterized protein NECHADRAFT_56358 [Fusarium vanettenii 77-13-4]|uniref:Pyruvate decarboxylase n=1 Tax=Fusarium vanettenii (strain ATCC MYA-4622 / CBS 123669 / FGSC 9596 / NRRL 45880 / 77-13-4) TaxID=660122 RepID=C7ZQT3_FUSV7|nr:uncharacterized protein NECHADRAFT_56358 [Fusarium vanettenii 77-13-4]EEU33630.1 hypothetical protein NECHADRAFT_56358 [Fusarium vanettenii 77-13-4]
MKDSSASHAHEIPLGTYIFRRLKQLGIGHIFGCPGDFNLQLLDYLYPEGLKWVGTCNELNGAYAADGYARTKGDGTPGVVITTYGVGELSALNGIAGAYSEHVPVVHIVGTTSRAAQEARIKIHHTLGDDGWDHTAFQAISKPVRRASAFLTDDATFTKDVDFVLEQSVQTRHPVYLFVPMDVPDIFVDGSRLETVCLNREIINGTAHEPEEQEAVEATMRALSSSRNGALLVDVLAQRYGLLDQVDQISQCWGAATTFITPLAKSFYDETRPYYGGLYNGDVQDTVSLHPDYVIVRGVRYNISFVPVVKMIAAKLGRNEHSSTHHHISPSKNSQHPAMPAEGDLDHARMWKTLSRHLREDDFIVAEVGTAQYGALELELGPRNGFLTQLFYSAIGYAVPALLGALCARREQGASGRVVFLAGDGGLQMSVQEISTIIRHGFAPTIILLDNNGYTTERIIHGPNLEHNDIAQWDHSLMLHFFGSQDSNYYQVRKFDEFEQALQKPAVVESRTPQLVHCYLGETDCPSVLAAKARMGKERSRVALARSDKEFGRRRNVTP